MQPTSCFGSFALLIRFSYVRFCYSACNIWTPIGVTPIEIVRRDPSGSHIHPVHLVAALVASMVMGDSSLELSRQHYRDCRRHWMQCTNLANRFLGNGALALRPCGRDTWAQTNRTAIEGT